MSKVKKIILVLVIALVVIQFIQPAKNKKDEFIAGNFAGLYKVPDSVQDILKVACYDCHSNNTRYPWYSNIQPVAWFMASHVDDGKRRLNFSVFGSYTTPQQVKKLKEAVKQIKDDEMPISSYTLIHTNAKLTPTQKSIVSGWMSKAADSLNTLVVIKN